METVTSRSTTMAEISEAPNQPEFDPETIRTTQPGLKRLILTFSVLISFLLGFPLLWKSVEIYRSPLPFNDVESLSNDITSYDHRQFPYNFHVILITSQALSHSLLPKINEIPLLSSNFTISVTVDPIDATSCTSFWLYPCGAIRAADFDFSDDEAVDESLRSILGSERVYSVVVVENAGVEETKAVVGKYRHGWIVAGEGKADKVVDRVAEMLEKVFVNGGKEKGVIHGEFMPVGADGRIVLSFNLLNSDPHDRVYDWDFQKIDETLLAPVIEALVPIASISVESQVLYHTPKSSLSSWNEKLGGYVFRMKDLPFFVNSNEWHLDTSIAAGGRSKILQFVVYIPSSKECPLLLQLPNGEISATNSFISPMWGGVMVWNPPNCLSNVESALHAMHMMSFQDLQKIFEVFMGQFRQLFGLKSNSIYVGSTGAYKLLASKRGFTQWELDVLARQYTSFNLRSSATTLGSLSRLVQSLPRMIIMDDIGKQVGVSLEAAKLAQTNASLGVYDASAVSSRQARSLAEDAFFHPSIMSVSYYSFEHCFAVYSPFFLPVSMHVLLAAIREWKRYKHENAKYLRWKATLNLAS